MHLKNINKKSLRMISGLRILSQKLRKDQLIKLVTAQYFGVTNYA